MENTEIIKDFNKQFIDFQKQYGGKFKYDLNGNIIAITDIDYDFETFVQHFNGIYDITPFTEETRATKKGIDHYLWSNANSFRRFKLFSQVKDRLTATVYWHGLATAFTGSDNLYHYRDEVRECFSSLKPYRHNLMNKKEKAYLANLGDRVTIYRAMTVEEKEIGEFGISWTLKYDVAEFFKNDYQRNYSTNNLKKVIVTKEINKDQVIAFFNNRKEFEIITIL